MTETITHEEWIAELQALAPAAGAEGLTSAEIAGQMGCSLRVARERLKRAVELRLWECAGRRAAVALDGKGTMVPVYRPRGRA